MSANKIIAELDAEQMSKEVPAFAPGDTVVVQVKVKEGNRERLQAFEGVCIGKRNRGVNSAFTVRKISHGVGVERTFQTYSPLVDSISVKRRGDVRQAKLYYLRELSGKAARIKEKLSKAKALALGSCIALSSRSWSVLRQPSGLSAVSVIIPAKPIDAMSRA